MNCGIIAVYHEGKKDMNYEYTYEEEASLSADREMFDSCCVSCAAEDAFYDIDLVKEEEKGENK